MRKGVMATVTTRFSNRKCIILQYKHSVVQQYSFENEQTREKPAYSRHIKETI